MQNPQTFFRDVSKFLSSQKISTVSDFLYCISMVLAQPAPPSDSCWSYKEKRLDPRLLIKLCTRVLFYTTNDLFIRTFIFYDSQHGKNPITALTMFVRKVFFFISDKNDFQAFRNVPWSHFPLAMLKM